MTASLNMSERLRQITSRWPNDYFLFLKLKELLSETKFSLESDVKTFTENWLNGQGVFLPSRVKVCDYPKILIWNPRKEVGLAFRQMPK
ncbi:hypothetical protein AVEN_131578-1 [Araneus ventricosus]|uniref:Uncharacterized protein n=1 Tax=Araneus ventricosus TaxID=182803 RepID=A0A4Y2H767_ARAVE|nr:hypothetical protein AVEN_131578-1 [Araneus ventricosus]